jgi:hypothetical protein
MRWLLRNFYTFNHLVDSYRNTISEWAVGFRYGNFTVTSVCTYLKMDSPRTSRCLSVDRIARLSFTRTFKSFNSSNCLDAVSWPRMSSFSSSLLAIFMITGIVSCLIIVKYSKDSEMNTGFRPNSEK